MTEVSIRCCTYKWGQHNLASYLGEWFTNNTRDCYTSVYILFCQTSMSCKLITMTYWITPDMNHTSVYLPIGWTEHHFYELADVVSLNCFVIKHL